MAFLDFRPFLALRRALNERYSSSLGGDFSTYAMLAWGLARHPALAGLKFLFPIDLAAQADRERTLGLVFARPQSYFHPARPIEGFLRFQHEFNRRLVATRARQSESYELVESFALLPAPFYQLPFRMIPASGGGRVGAVCASGPVERLEAYLEAVAEIAGGSAFGGLMGE